MSKIGQVSCLQLSKAGQVSCLQYTLSFHMPHPSPPCQHGRVFPGRVSVTCSFMSLMAQMAPNDLDLTQVIAYSAGVGSISAMKRNHLCNWLHSTPDAENAECRYDKSSAWAHDLCGPRGQ